MALDPLLFNIAGALFSLAILFVAADYIILGISGYARKLGLSDAITGLVVIAIAASMPEVIASIIGILIGREEILIGTILGTNMVHTTLVTGTLLLVGKKLKFESTLLSKAKLPLWIAMMLPFVLMLDGTLSRFDGVILIAAFIVYIVLLWRREGTFGKMKKNVKLKYIWRDSLIFLFALVALIITARVFVFSAVNVAEILNIPTYFIALTVLGIGGAIPDFALGLRSIFRGHSDIGIGDILGSIMIELLLFFGIIALINPITFDPSIVLTTLLFLAGSITVLMLLMRKKTVTWKHGILLLAIYAAFITVEVIKIL